MIDPKMNEQPGIVLPAVDRVSGRGPCSFISSPFTAIGLAFVMLCPCAFLSGCVESKCYENADCPAPKVCSSSGSCVFECSADSDCSQGFICVDHRCKPEEDAGHGDGGAADAAVLPGSDATGFGDGGGDVADHAAEPDAGPASGCPPDMVPVVNYCIDRYEASRSDATASSAGTSFVAASRPGVIPWFPVTLSQARAGCASMEKRLCAAEEWFQVCTGPSQNAYVYGNSYDPVTCNGIDTYCNCSAPVCASLQSCPYPHCYDTPSPTESGGPCGSSVHVMPTGSFAQCTNEYGAYDIAGNVWEIVDSNDGKEHFRGGAFNCRDSEALHRCDHDATWGPSAKGFRCCKERVFQ